MSWDYARKAAAEAGKGGKFVKVEDGDSIVLAFLGEPSVRRTIWVPDENKSVPFDEEKHKGKRPTYKFKLNCVAVKDEPETVKILDCGVRLFDQISKAIEKYSQDCMLEISREGTGKKTKYAVMFEDKLTDDQKKHLAKLDLNPLDVETETTPEQAQEDEDMGAPPF